MRALAPLAACLILAGASLALAVEGDQPPAAGRPPSGMGPQMMNMDSDGDGVVTRDEFMAAHGGADFRFAQLDKNKDGVVSRDEWLAEPAGSNRAQRFSQLDTNGDGRITHTELEASRNARFDAMDANHDGKLAAQEMPHGRGPMMRQQSQMPKQ